MDGIIFQQPMTLVKHVGIDFRAHMLSPKINFERGKLYLIDTKQCNRLLRKRGDQFLVLSTEDITYEVSSIEPPKDGKINDKIDGKIDDEIDLDTYLNT